MIEEQEKSLEFLAGISGGASIPKFKEIRLDNGDDLLRTNATDEFVIKTGRKGSFVREKLGKELEIVVLLQRAVISKSRKVGRERVKEWYSSEFNPLNVEELIKIRKPDTKGYTEMTYKDVQAHYPKVQGESGLKNPFTYENILYIKNLSDGEVYKMSLGGGQLSSWFKFKDENQVNLWETSLIVKSIFSEEDGRSNLEFSIGKAIDVKRIRIDVGDLISQLPINKTIAIAAPIEKARISAPVQKEEAIPIIEVDDDLEQANAEAQIASEEDKDEVIIEDVPF